MQDDKTVNTNLRSLGRYQLLRRIGRGGMGEVWLSEDPRLRRQIAIKILPPHNQDDQEFSARFEREAQAAAALNHPHVLPVHDYGEHRLPNGQTITYIVMPYVEGNSLADRLNTLATNQEGMAQDEALNYLAQAAEAIDYAHSHGVIHRDIKPANMLLRPDKWLMLADFGIARVLSNTDKLTQAGTGIGTPEYMAPEQAQGHSVSASDNYSLAIIAYQLFTGRLPFSAETSYATVIQHLTLQPPQPRQFNPYLPEACEQVLLRGLVKDPTARYSSASQFVEELRSTLASYKSTLYPPSSHPQQSTPQSHHNHEVNTPTTPSQDSLPTRVNEGNKQVSTDKTNHHRTRRNILIGGATALVTIGAGTGIWAFTTHQPSSPRLTTSSPSSAQSTSTANPDGPALILREHNLPANSLTWSPTQNILYSASNDRTIKRWNINQLQSQKKEQYTSTGSWDFKGASKELTWTADGQYLAISNSRIPTSDQISSTIDVYKSDLSTIIPGLENGITIPELIVEGIGWYNNTYLVGVWYDLAASNQFTIGLWNPFDINQSFKPINVPNNLYVEISSVKRDLIVSPDSTRIAFCSDDGVLIGNLDVQNNTFKWNPASYSPLQNSPQGVLINRVKTVAWTANSNSIIGIVEDGYPNNKILGWNIKNNPQDAFQFGTPNSSNYFTTVATYPTTDKALFAAGTKDGAIYLWDTDRNNIPIRTLNSGGITAEILALVWSFDGQWLAASYKDTNASILVWKL